MAFIGLAGLPDDIATWAQWIDRMAYDPIVLDLAARAVEISGFVNQWWVRGLLILVGLSLAAWAWRPFWRLRHRISFRWRRALAEQVWISEDDAIKVMRESTWGRLKEPVIVTSFNILTQIVGAREITSGLSDDQKKRLKFNAFLDMTLVKFCEVNSAFCRTAESGREIEEVALRDFLAKAVESEIVDDFGDLPDFKVS